MKKKTLSLFLSAFLLFQPALNVYAANDIEISITKKPEIDVVLTSVSSDFDLTNFENDIKSALSNKGLDTSNMKIESVETTQVSTESTTAQQIVDTWKCFYAVNMANTSNATANYGPGSKHTDNQYNLYKSYYKKPITSWNTFYSTANNRVQMIKGAQRPAVAFFDDSEKALKTGNATISFNYGIDASNYETFTDGEAGFLFKIQDEGNYYAYIMDNHDLCGNAGYTYKEVLIKSVNGVWYYIDSHTLPAYSAGMKWNIEIQLQGDNIKIFREGNKIFDYDDNTSIGGNSPLYQKGSYGFYVWNQKGAYFSNIQINSSSAKEFSEILYNSSWRNESDHYIVNIDNNADTSFSDANTKGEILTRTINDNISFIQWGNDSNKQLMENFINENNNNGIFITADNYEEALRKTVEFIIDKYDVEQNTEQTILVNESADINVTPEIYKNNTKDVEFPNGKWMIHHDYKYFDNNNGQFEGADIYTDALQENILFDKVGKYEISFADNIAQTILVHRRPIATFNAKVNNDNTISLTSSSYDLDSNIDTGLGKGITEEKWSYKKLEDNTWTEGKPENVNNGESYVIQLQVKDNQNTWSESTSKFITLSNQISVPPVAQFNFENSKIFINDNLLINNTSYDPSGKNITKEEWTLKKDGVQIGVYTSPIINFSTLGTGNYSYTLKVTNSDNVESEGYTKSFTVETDTKKPVATIDPTYSDWTDSLDINITIEDFESGLKYWRYVYTQSQDKPADSAYGAWQTNSEESLHFDTDGEYYLHIQAVDNAGNVLDRTVGSYKITHPYTNKVTHNFGVSNKTEFVTFDWGKWYNPTTEFEEKVNGFELKDTFMANYPTTGTIYNKTDRLKQPSGAIEYTFAYQPVEYTATIDYGFNEDTETKTFTVLEGFDLEKPVREGYEFVGWYVEDKLIKDVNFNKNNTFASFEEFKNAMDSRTAEDITITARWNKAEFTEKTNVFAQIASEYKVTIPKTVVLSGTSKAASYFVKVEGDIAGYEDITVTPDDTFTLTSKNKDNQNANIVQDKVTWTVHDFDTDANGTISAPDITAGKWMGAFNFNIEFNSPDEENVNSEESIEYQTIEYPTNE